MYRYSYDDIANRHIDTVYRLALARTKSREHAEDVTQEVFLKLMQTKKRFASEEHIKAWLIRVTINYTKDLFMSAWFKRNVPLEDDVPAPKEEESGLYDAVMQLPAQYRTAIHLHYYEGYSVKEIAEITNSAEGTVKSALSRGRDKLKEILEGGEPV